MTDGPVIRTEGSIVGDTIQDATAVLDVTPHPVVTETDTLYGTPGIILLAASVTVLMELKPTIEDNKVPADNH